jgi:hypothetical protein
MTGHASAVQGSNLLSRHVRAGKVYRREDLLPYSNSVDRELQRLVSAGTLRKLAQGLYFKPKKMCSVTCRPTKRTCSRHSCATRTF